MQERGDLVKDQEGLWIESQNLDWDKLPTKVEGVIEERIGRLQAELKEVLTVGSVQGEDFTAEVVARVQQAEAGGLIRKLSGELQRQHKLVHGEGVRRLDPGGQRLSLFRFQHNLFRTYLYNELSEAERVYLHEDVGRALEALYGEQADEIAVQLAHHFELAGVDDKARHYLQKAGEQAAARYANEEAIVYFTRALALTPETDAEKRYELLLLRESIYSRMGNVEFQQQDIDILMDIVHQVNNEKWLAEVLFRKSQYNQSIGDFQSVVEIAADMIQLSDVLHDNKVKIRGHLVAGVAETSRGNQEVARDHLIKSLELSINEGRQHEEMQCLRSLSSIEREQSKFDEAIANCESALDLARKNYERIEESKILIILGNLSSDQGNESKARKYYDEALPILREVGSRPNEAILLSNMGCTYANKGDYRTALPYFEQARKISHDVGYREMECIALGNLGELSASLGKFIEAKNYFNEALNINREIGYKFSEMIVLSQLGQIFESLGEYSLARENLEKSLLLTIELESREWEVKLYSEIGRLLDAIGLYHESNQEFINALEIAENFDVKSEECDAWAYRGLLLHHLSQNREAETFINKALDIAKVIDVESTERFAYLHLGNILTSLGNYDKARDYYSKSLKMTTFMGQTYLIPEIQAGQARVAILEGKLDEAMKYVEQILVFLKEHNLDGTDEPMRIYLTCNQVLQANGDPGADDILIQAYTILMERAEMIKDDAMRQSYLENVEANLAVRLAYQGLF
jgi:tetratricopeptide (TPR) repeat protein